MNKMKLILTFGVALLFALLYGISTSHSELNQSNRLKMKLKKPNETQERPIANNNWKFYLRNDGSYMYKASSSQFGGEFPRGTNYSCVYAAGMYIAGLKAGTGGDPDTVNVANCEFQSEFLPGKVLVNGAKDNKYRGYVDPNTGGDVTQTADFGQLTADSYLSGEYKVYLIPVNNTGPNDYANWPAYAPRTDAGEPLLLSGASSQTYSVFNDLSLNKVSDEFSLSPGFGLEMELESFTFTAGLLNNGIFMKLSITNKSSADYRGAYLGLWADPDVGSNTGDDIADVDTNRGLGMVYSDPAGADAAKTALGLDFLQGPVVDSADVSLALYNKFYNDPAYRSVLKFNRTNSLLELVALPPGQFRLGATAFLAYANGQGDPDGRGSGDLSRYWYVSGYDMVGNPKPNGPFDPTVNGANPSDQRIIHGVGPFVLKAGQTQELWLGFAGARGSFNGPGVGYSIYNPQPLSAVQLMAAVDDAMQIAFDNALAAPVAPIPPMVTATAYDGKVVLTWDNRSEYSYDSFGRLLGVRQPAFNKNWRDYDFEGYRVYRSLTGFEEAWEQVAEYDLINGITTENDTMNDARGTVLYDQYFGSDNGIDHKYVDTTVTNQRYYYYSVTAYDYQPLFRSSTDQSIAGYPRTLECTKFTSTNLKMVIPMAAPAGYQYDGSVNNSLARVAGTYANAYLRTTVVDPVRLRDNKTYTIEFFTLKADTVTNRVLRGITPGTLAFRMRDNASGDLVPFDNYTDDPRTYYDTLPSNDTFKIAEGDKVYDDSYYCTLISYLRIDGTEQGLSPTQILPRFNGVELKLISDTVGVRDIYEVGTGGSLTSVLYQASPAGKYKVLGYNGGTLGILDSVNRYGTVRNALNPIGSFINSDYEIRFMTDAADSSVIFLGGMSANVATGNFNRCRNRVPFQIWNIGWNGLDTNDYRLEVKMNGIFPHVVNTPVFTMNNLVAGVQKYSERFQIIDSAYIGDTNQTRMQAIDPSLWKMGNFVIMNLDTIEAYPPPGTTIRIVSFRPVLDGAQLLYNQVGNTPKSAKLAKKVIKDIKVVPNPYYGRVHEYQQSLFDKKVKFINLPDVCTIRIFNIAGDLLRTIRHNASSHNNRVDADPLNRTKDISDIDALSTSTEEWDLRNSKSAFVASGMYVALIEAPGIGKTTVKFAVIQEEMRINGPDVR